MSPTPPMTTPTTTSKVFVYGSLRSTDVLHAILQRTPICAKGSLASPAYKRVCVRDAPYPAVIRSSATTTSGGIVDGLLLRDITPNELELFDAFEDEYERIQVDVQIATTSTTETAFMYLWNQPTSELVDTPWDFEAFTSDANLLTNYVNNSRLFREDYELQ